jgi:ABC-type transport system involved in cytochrome bd biosynthesis fused ATPase/permease subunit
MKTFDFYEFTGVLCPGVVVLFSMVLIVPEFAPILQDQSVTVGALGLFVVLSYVAGHLVQAFGNLLENGIWRIFGGIPTDWVRTRKHKLLTDSQAATVEQRLRDQMGKPLADLTAGEWYTMTRSVYAMVANAGRSTRVDTFNGNYGLFRGLVAAFLLSDVIVVATLTFEWATVLILLACALLAVTRMRRFGVHYARELFVQFLRIPAAGDSAGAA